LYREVFILFTNISINYIKGGLIMDITMCPNKDLQPYNNFCPYNKLPKPVLLNEVITTPLITLEISLKYTDTKLDHKVKIETGVRYKFTYFANGILNEIIGVVTGISKITSPAYGADSYPRDPNEYLLKIDASANYASTVITIKTTQIRGLVRYVPHADESTTIQISTTHGGITVGTVQNITVKDATFDGSTISDGKIDGGKVIDGGTSGGTSTGKNENGNEITTDGGYTTGGSIKATIIRGVVTSASVMDGTYENGIYKHCTVIADSAKIIANNSTITGGTTVGGKVIEAVLTSSTVSGGTRTGDDMVTIGGTIIDGVCYGGQTTGGTLQGGTAVGIINDAYYTIEDGTTTGGITSGGTVTGGIVTGGYTVGNTTIGGKMTGGTCIDGTTTGGTTVSGTLIPGATGNIASNFVLDSTKAAIDNKYTPGTITGNIDGFIVWYLENYGIGSNIGTYPFNF
jgi:hypothetical protein